MCQILVSVVSAYGAIIGKTILIVVKPRFYRYVNLNHLGYGEVLELIF